MNQGNQPEKTWSASPENAASGKKAAFGSTLALD
jgi:hypothetical protein